MASRANVQSNIQKLCNEVQLREFIWNPCSPLHSDAQKLDEAWRNISQKIEFPPEICKKAWVSLHESYRSHQGFPEKTYFPNLSFLNKTTIKRKSAETASDDSPKKRIIIQGSSSDEASSSNGNNWSSKTMTVVFAGSTGATVFSKENELANTHPASLPKQVVPVSMLKHTVPATMLKHAIPASLLKQVNPTVTQIQVIGPITQKHTTPIDTQKKTPPTTAHKQPTPSTSPKSVAPATTLTQKTTPAVTRKLSDPSASPKFAPSPTQQQPDSVTSKSSSGPENVNCEPTSFESSFQIKDELVEEVPAAFIQKKFTLESLIVPQDTQCNSQQNQETLVKDELEPESSDYLEIRKPTISAVPTAMLLEKRNIPTTGRSSIDSPFRSDRRDHNYEFSSIYMPPSREIFSPPKVTNDCESVEQEVRTTPRKDSELCDSEHRERIYLNSTPATAAPPTSYNLRNNTRMPFKLHNLQLNALKTPPTMILKTYGGPRMFGPKQYGFIPDKNGAIAKQLASYWQKSDSVSALSASPTNTPQPIEVQIEKTEVLSKRSIRESLESNSSIQSAHYVVSATSPITVTSQEDRAACEMPGPPLGAPLDSTKHTTTIENLAQKLSALIETQNKLLTNIEIVSRIKTACGTSALSEAVTTTNEATTSSMTTAKVSAYQWALNTFDFMLNQLTPTTADKAVAEVCELLMAKMKEEQIKK